MSTSPVSHIDTKVVGEITTQFYVGSKQYISVEWNTFGEID